MDGAGVHRLRTLHSTIPTTTSVGGSFVFIPAPRSATSIYMGKCKQDVCSLSPYLRPKGARVALDESSTPPLVFLPREGEREGVLGRVFIRSRLSVRANSLATTRPSHLKTLGKAGLFWRGGEFLMYALFNQTRSSRQRRRRRRGNIIHGTSSA